MANGITGITVQLYEQTLTGTDAFNRPIYTETAVDVDDVLIGEPSSQDVVDELNLSGRMLAYTLAIPKGDTHAWEGKKVGFFGDTFRVIGKPTQGIEANIPLRWNKKVKVERYE
jgi:hypothetical protein